MERELKHKNTHLDGQKNQVEQKTVACTPLKEEYLLKK